jgi:hypothetical protein
MKKKIIPTLFILLTAGIIFYLMAPVRTASTTEEFKMPVQIVHTYRVSKVIANGHTIDTHGTIEIMDDGVLKMNIPGYDTGKLQVSSQSWSKNRYVLSPDKDHSFFAFTEKPLKSRAVLSARGAESKFSMYYYNQKLKEYVLSRTYIMKW